MAFRLNSLCSDLFSNLYSQLLLGSYVYFANPEANWGSASQAQTILTAMNATQVASSHIDVFSCYKTNHLRRSLTLQTT